MGIEPTSEAWEAPVLPLNYARSLFQLNAGNGLFVQRLQSLTRLHLSRQCSFLPDNPIFEQLRVC